MKLKPNLSSTEQAKLFAAHGGTRKARLQRLKLDVVNLAPGELEKAIARFKADPRVESVEIDHLRSAAGVPSDSSYASQWALPKIGWEQVYGVTNPTGTATVAILDAGIDATHPDLTGKVIPGTSILDGSDGRTDATGHGTMLAGIIAAAADNGIGIAGVAPAGVKVMPVTVLDAAGTGLDSNIIAGILWAADHGADVILMPFSNPTFSQALQEAVDYAWSKGAVLIAATGNGGSTNPTFPAGDRGVVGVSATTQSDTLYTGANHGPDTFVVAPGVAIYSTTRGGSYGEITGTSASAAVVAGIVSYMKAVDPTLTNGLIVSRLGQSADQNEGMTLPGYGLVNLADALSSVTMTPLQPAGVGTVEPFQDPYQAAGACDKLRFRTLPLTTPVGQMSGQINVAAHNGNYYCSLPVGANTVDLSSSSSSYKFFLRDDTSGVFTEITRATLLDKRDEWNNTIHEAYIFYRDMIAGSPTITATLPALPNPSVSQTQTITPATQTITFTSPAPANAQVGGAAYIPTATGGASGNPVVLTIAPASSSVCSLSGGAVSFTAVGTCTINANQIGNANYLAAPQVQQSFSVGKGNQTITFNSLPERTYGNGSFALSATSSSSLQVSFAIVSGPASIAGDMVTLTGAGTVVVRASQSGNENYIAAPSVDRSFNVNPAMLTVTALNASRPYNTANPSFSASYDGFIGSDTFNSSVTGAPSLTTSAVQTSPTGSYPITAAAGSLASTNYTFSFVPGTLTVGAADQSITFAPLPDRTYGNASFALSATASSSLPVSYTVVSGPAVIAGDTVTLTGAGTVVVRASQAGDANYNAAPSVERSFTVSPATLTVTAENASRPFNTANPTFSARYSGFVGTDSFASSVTGTPSLTTAAIQSSAGGSYPIVAAAGTLASTNYTFSFAAGTLTVEAIGQSITFAPLEERSYGSAPFTLSATASSSLPVSFAIVSGPAAIAGDTVTLTGAGTVVVRASQPGNESYNAAPSVERSFTVKPATLTVTADNASRPYNTANPSFSASYSGFVGSDSFASSVTGTPSLTTIATQSSAGGSYPIVAATGTLASTNYSFSFVAGTLTVEAIDQSITFDALPEKTYGSAPFALSATASSSLPVSFTVVSGPAAITGDTVTLTGAGTVVVRASQSGSVSYNAAPNVERSFTVKPATLTVTADSASRPYNTANPSFSASYSGFVGADTFASNVTGTPSLTTTATQSSPAGSYEITAADGTLASTNYSFSFVAGTLTVAPADQSITFAPLTERTYGSGAFTLSATASSSLPVSFAVVSGPATIAGNTVTLTGAGTVVVRASQPGNLDYHAAPGVERSFTVNPATLTVSAENASRPYNTVNPSFSASYSGFVGSDSFASSVTGTPSLTTTATQSSAGGSYPIVAAAGTLASTNYTFSFAAGTLTVEAIGQSITFAPLEERSYGSAPFTLSATASSSLPVSFAIVSGPATIAGDTVTLTGAGPVVVRASQPGNESYNAAPSVERSFTVKPATLTVTADNASRPYNTANPSFGASYSGFVGSDSFASSVTGTPSLTTTATQSSAGGSYPIVAAAGTLASTNYSFSFVPGTLTVEAIDQSITFAPLTDRTYGSGSFTLSATASSSLPVSFSIVSGPATIAGDTVTLTGAGPVVVRASQAGDKSYNAASSVGRSFTVHPATLTVTADNASRPYNTANPSFSASYSGFVGGDSFASSVTGTPSLTTTATQSSAGGSYPIVAAAGTLASTNYSFSFVPGTLTVEPIGQSITFNALPERTYGSGSFTLSATASSSLPVSFAVVSGPATIANKTVTLTGAGTVVVRASQPGNESYNVAPGVERSFTVKPATLTVTADNAHRPYNTTNPTFSASYLGFVGGDSFASSVTGSPSLTTTATETSPAGTYPITAAVGTLASTNYTFSFVTGTLVVGTIDQSITFAPVSEKTYGSGSFALSATASSLMPVSFAVVSGPASITGNTVTLTGAGTVVLRASQPGNDSYNPASVEQTVAVRPAPLTVSAGNASRPYNTANPGFSASYSGFIGADSFASSVTGTPSFITTATESSPVGSYPITAAAGSLASTNYTFSFVGGTLAVVKADATVTLEQLSQTYDTTAKSVTVVTNPAGLAVDVTYDGSAAAPAAAGSYAVVATVDNPNYKGSAGGTLVIGQAPQTITFAPLTNKTYGAADFSLTAASSSGLPVSFASDNPAVATVNAQGELHITGQGSVNITASQNGDDNYLAAEAVQQRLTVEKAVIAVKANDDSRPYGAPDPSFSATYTGLAYGESAENVVRGAPAFTTNADLSSPVGSYRITPAIGTLEADNYSFTFQEGVLAIGLANQSITFNPLAARSYGSGSFELQYTPGASGNEVTFASSDESVATVSGRTVTVKKAGSTRIVAYQAGTVNYAEATAEQTLSVTKAQLLVVAENKERPYDSPNPDLTWKYNGFLNGDDQSVLTGAPVLDTKALPSSPVGEYAITVAPGTLDAVNYSFTPVHGVLAVGKATQTIVFDALQPKTYGDPSFTLSAQGGPSGNTVTFASSDTTIATISGDTVTIVGAGNVTIIANQNGSPNYAPASAQQPLTVGKATLTVRANDASRRYNSADPSFSVSYEGFVRGDLATTPGVLAGAPALTTEAKADSVPGEYAIVPSVGNLYSTKYDFSYENGVLQLLKGLQGNVTVIAPGSARYAQTGVFVAATGGDGIGAYSFKTVDSTACRIDDPASGVVTITSGTGSCAVSATRAGDAIFEESAPSLAASIAITKAAQSTVTVNAPQTLFYNSTAVLTGGGGNGGGDISFSSGSSTGCMVDGNVLSVTNASGNCSVTALKEADANFAAATSAAATVELKKAGQSPVTVSVPARATFGQQGVLAVAAGGNGKGAYSYSSGSSTACSVKADTGLIAIISGTGSCAISATRGGDDNYQISAASQPVSLAVDKADQGLLTVAVPASLAYGSSTRLSTNGGSGTGLVTYSAGNSNGCTVSGNTISVTDAGGSCSVWATKEGDNNHNGTTSPSATVTLERAVPVIRWNNPRSIGVGTSLSGKVLNASAELQGGTFVYTPPAGTLLPVGSGQKLTVAYTPSDTRNYTQATKSVFITVEPATKPVAVDGPPTGNFANLKNGKSFAITRTHPGSGAVTFLGNTSNTTFTDSTPLKPNTIYRYAVASETDPTQTVFMTVRTPLANGWNIVAVPYDTAQVPASTFFGERVSEIYQWIPTGATSESSETQLGSYVTVNNVTPGLGYFTRAYSGTTALDYAGNVSRDSATVTLKPGWTMIANPALENKTNIGENWLVDGVPLSFLINAGKIGGGIYWWNGTTYESWSIMQNNPQVEPWKGYWMLNLDNVNHTLTIK